jgi:hypothetical protein
LIATPDHLANTQFPTFKTSSNMPASTTLRLPNPFDGLDKITPRPPEQRLGPNFLDEVTPSVAFAKKRPVNTNKKPGKETDFQLSDDNKLFIRTQIAAGKPQSQIAYMIVGTHVGLVNDAKKAIKEFVEAPEVEVAGWWKKEDGRKPGTFVLEVDKYLFQCELVNAGFYMLAHEGEKPILVRVTDNVVEEATRRDMKLFILQQIQALPERVGGVDRVELINLILDKHKGIFEQDVIDFLPNLQGDFVRDTRSEAFFFMRNGWVEITATTSLLRPYKELPGLIWKSQIRPYDYVELSADAYLQCDIHAFLLNVFGHNPARVRAAQLALGYLLHLYKDDTNTKAIIFEDKEAAPGESNGRTGKSLLLKAISHLRNLVFIDGRLFSFENNFKWQLVKRDTDVIVFDEFRENQSLAPLFGSITLPFSVNHKNQPEFTIPFTRSPKFAITTNSVITGDGDSFADRKVKLALDKFYTPTKKPADVHGRAFFGQEWDADGGEWNRFINLAIGWVQLLLANGRKLESVQLAETTEREFIANTHESFPKFLRDMKAIAREDKHDSTTEQGLVCIWLDEAYRIFNGDLGAKEQVGKTKVAKYMRTAGCQTDRETRRQHRYYGQTYFTWGETREG